MESLLLARRAVSCTTERRDRVTVSRVQTEVWVYKCEELALPALASPLDMLICPTGSPSDLTVTVVFLR